MQKLLNEWRKYLLEEAQQEPHMGAVPIGAFTDPSGRTMRMWQYKPARKNDDGELVAGFVQDQQQCKEGGCQRPEEVMYGGWKRFMPKPYGRCTDATKCYVKVEAKPEAAPLPRPATPT